MKFNSSKAQIKSTDTGVDGNYFQARPNGFITIHWLDKKSRAGEIGKAVHLRSKENK